MRRFGTNFLLFGLLCGTVVAGLVTLVITIVLILLMFFLRDRLEKIPLIGILALLGFIAVIVLLLLFLAQGLMVIGGFYGVYASRMAFEKSIRGANYTHSMSSKSSFTLPRR